MCCSTSYPHTPVASLASSTCWQTTTRSWTSLISPFHRLRWTRCLSTLPRIRLMTTASQMWSSATGQYSQTHLSTELILPSINHNHQLFLLNQAKVHTCLGNHLTASQRRVSRKKKNLAKANLALQQCAHYHSQRKWPGRWLR